MKSKMTKNDLFLNFLLTFLTHNYSEYKCMRRHILIDNTIKIIFIIVTSFKRLFSTFFNSFNRL